MKRALIAAAIASLLLGGAAAAKTPAYITAAIADKNRPAEDSARDVDRKPAAMLEFAGIKPGMKVVDVIPGKGYFTRIFAVAVGAKGWVYSFEPTEFDGVYKSHNIAVPTGSVPNYSNASYIHESIAKFALPEQVDVVWTSQNYHDLHDKFAGPVDLAVANKAIFDALKPGGVFIVLDHAALPGSGLAATDTPTLRRLVALLGDSRDNPLDSGKSYLNFLRAVADSDISGLRTSEKSYGNSWKLRGGVDTFHMLKRKWERLEKRVASDIDATAAAPGARGR